MSADYHRISATVGFIAIKFGMVMHMVSLNRIGCKKFKFLRIQDKGH